MFSSPLVLQIPSSMQMTDEQFFEFCQVNRDLRIERNKFGELVIMPPTGSETGNREGNIFGSLWVWSEEDTTGITFSSSTGFKLSTGAERSPDASWIKLGITVPKRENCTLRLKAISPKHFSDTCGYSLLIAMAPFTMLSIKRVMTLVLSIAF
ncbi:MAG: Uma2 family endonuclease [Nostoc sp.]|uniref:Uma2 family endonuclease n=1 Tax=Nostoc sp. TaxID=1180 RepID=UPI002FFB6FA1